MLFRADCQWCGDRVRAYQPSRRREFLDEHTASCGASGNLRWIVYLRAQRDAVSGVSLDEEMADLVKYQRAFQASSRVFTIVDDLLDTVVNGLGR